MSHAKTVTNVPATVVFCMHDRARRASGRTPLKVASGMKSAWPHATLSDHDIDAMAPLKTRPRPRSIMLGNGVAPATSTSSAFVGRRSFLIKRFAIMAWPCERFWELVP